MYGGGRGGGGGELGQGGVGLTLSKVVCAGCALYVGRSERVLAWCRRGTVRCSVCCVRCL